MTSPHSGQTASIGELIERLEKAEAGSRELDIAVSRALGEAYDGYSWRKRPTQVLDAALALAERVLPGWWMQVQTSYRSDEHPNLRWFAEFEWPEPVVIQSYGETLTSHEFYYASAPTPALALCIAILRAHSNQGADHVQ